MELQPTINIGTLGHVAHGKSTLVKKLTGTSTMRHSTELPRGITIKLGYANMKIWKCPNCPRPECYSSTNSEIMSSKCKICQTNQTLIRHISFVDCPGHEILMATMLNGVAVMDGAILVIAANEYCPQAQTIEHLVSADIMGIKNMVCVQTKLDLIKKEEAKSHYNNIKLFIEGTSAEKSPIIPICSHHNLNLDILLDYLVHSIPEPIRDLTKSPRIIVIRSFDINKPGCEMEQLLGGVLGGTLQYGEIKIGDRMEMRPGIIIKSEEEVKCYPIKFPILSLMSENNNLQRAIPGGLIAIGTNLDPFLTKNDKMVGQVIGYEGQLAPIYKEIIIEYTLIRRVCIKDQLKIKKPSLGELLRLNINSMMVHGKILDSKDLTNNRQIRISLDLPICIEIGDNITISRSYENKYRLIGWGKFIEGTKYSLS